VFALFDLKTVEGIPMTTEPANHSPIVQAPLFPPYADVEHAIRLLDGEPVKRVREMMKAIYEQAGTPQNPS
jgi:hypothetical protein